jgi:D-alanyl-D-alanine carboxypeptidase/D-alanyl-D-alanine-endopeptidase (penicillin-binding protein 4)
MNRKVFVLLGIIASVVFAPLGTSAQHNLRLSNRVASGISWPAVTSETDKTIAASPSSTDLDASLLGALPVVSGSRGVLVERLDKQLVMEQSPDDTFNPASCVKLATALAALRSFGANYRYSTAVWTDGVFDKATSTITGDLIISGRDPSFHWEHAVMLAQELNRLGIRTVTGDLIVAPRFTMDFDGSAQRSGNYLYDTLDHTRRSALATTAWTDQRKAVGDNVSLQTVPSVAVMGAVYVDSVPPRARILITHKSSKLTDILKALLCFSNNFMAQLIGETLGGPEGVRQMMITKFGVNASEIHLASTSGLYANRMTPRAMMKIFRALRDELAVYGMTAADIMPVAGIDPGTLEKRYLEVASRGSVIAKTGTLLRTDGGASALAGQMLTASGETLLFVIFNMSGDVLRFREYQDALVTQIQCTLGGPAPFNYRSQALTIRLAGSEIDTSKPGQEDEYEPGAK